MSNKEIALDKKTYWENRKAGKRGQGEYPETVVGVTYAKQRVAGGSRRQRRAK
jgi:hypothetical protein